MSLVAWWAQEADVSSARAATREARARLPVLSPGLSLDPKPKVVRPKTKINFTIKVKCYSIPTLETAVVRAIDRPRAARGQELPGVGLLRQGARAAGRVN